MSKSWLNLLFWRGYQINRALKTASERRNYFINSLTLSKKHNGATFSSIAKNILKLFFLLEADSTIERKTYRSASACAAVHLNSGWHGHAGKTHKNKGGKRSWINIQNGNIWARFWVYFSVKGVLWGRLAYGKQRK